MKMFQTRSLLARRFLIPLLLLSLFVGFGPAQAFQDLGDYESNRARLLGYLLKQHLSAQHFSHKEIDDNFSEAAFSLFLKQLDGQKRFLLREDVQKLRKYLDRIDDELKTGKMELPVEGEDILAKRASQVHKMVSDILSKDFDFSREEYIETDPEKLDYCTTLAELRDRWRKTLKYQAIHEYLNLIEEKKAAVENPDSEAKDVQKEGTKSSREALMKEVREKLLKNHKTIFDRMENEKEREYYNIYFSSIARAFDPHTDYMPPTDKEDFDIHMRGSLEGIGATLSEKDGFIKVVDVLPGGPAYRQGQLHSEDLIIKVAEGKSEPADLTGMRVRDAVKLIRGKKGTEVRLTVMKPDGSRLVIPIVRDVVQLKDTFAKGATIKDEKSGKTFGYIKIPSFYRDFETRFNGGTGRNCTDDVRKEIEKLASAGIGGLIVDLRNNGGGALTDAVNIAGLFIGTGPVVQVKDSSGKITVLSDTDPDISYKGPVIVLVNKISASASEIFAGALQDYGRAVIMGGEHTHGKGTVQSIIPLDERIPFQNMDKYKTLGALRVTIQKFYRISGESTQYKGVHPDIVLPDRWKNLKSGEQHLDFALPWDRIDPSPYTKWSMLQPDVSDLRSKSSKRISKDKNFVEMEREIEKSAELQEKTRKPINIEDARKEREELKSQRKEDMDGLHGRPETGKNGDKELSEAEEKKAWISKLREDPYIEEGIAVLDDILSAARQGVTVN
jgi:carboxyl-terminal processing protease